jgi:glycyl-tRNA synthetase (class II)
MKEGPLAGQKDTVTLRHRDDGRQDRVKISELLPLLLERIH